MKVKKLLICIMACAICLSLCACPPIPVETTTTTTTTTSRKNSDKRTPDYMSQLKQYLGVDPAPSTFTELVSFSQKRMDKTGFFRDDKEHYCCEFVYRGNHFCVIRYEKAQEWFEYRFTPGIDYLNYEKDDNGTLIIRNESYSGPEGMLMPYNFRAFVDDSGKYLVMAGGDHNIPEIPDADIAAFNGDDKEESYVSVQEFRYYYSLDDSEIEDYLIEDYIFMNHINEFELA